MLTRLLNRNVQAGPAYAKKSFFGDEQQAFHLRLRQALPNCFIFPEVTLSALLTPTATDARRVRQQQEQLDARTLAFGIFDSAMMLLCVIELTHAGVDEVARALTQEILHDADIKCFSWQHDRLPTTEQILRAMAAYTNIAPPKFEAAANSSLRFDSLGPMSRLPEQPKRQLSVTATSLTMAQLAELTPNGSVKAAYPHIWERICLFCTEPRHLEHYLSSLSLQDRGGKRAGFPESVIAELAELQGANARFIPSQIEVRTSWNDVFFNR